MSNTSVSDFEFLRPRWERNTVKSQGEACWEWILRPDSQGYGQLKYGRNQVIRAHRLSYLLNVGEIPDGMVVMHRCDNRICVRPSHLTLGTRAENLADCRAKGRWHNHKKVERQRVGRKGPVPIHPAERLWEKVEIGATGECWPFVGGLDKDGYGRVSIGRERHVRAHRVAYESKNGPIPDGLVVMHVCDNPPCCNPAHLLLGTRGDNNRDRSEKGRGRENNQWGARNPRSKLTAEMVLAIRATVAAGLTQTEVADQFGIKQPQVSRLVRGLSWPDGPWPEGHEIDRSQE